MRASIFIAVIILLICSCSKDKNEGCNTDSPLTELSWLTSLKDSIDSDCTGCETTIFQAEYGSETVFYSRMTDILCDGYSEYYVQLINCDGVLVKSYTYSNMEEFSQEVTNIKKLYSCVPGN